MTRYALYARTSSDAQEARATIQSQLSDARAYEERHHLRIALRYLDDGVSSRVPFASRPEGARLLGDARSGLFTHVLVQDFTRVGFALDLLKVAEEMETVGVKLVSIMEPMPGGDDASVATLFRTMLAGFGQYRVDTIRRKSVVGKERAAREGRWNGGVPPFGYRVEARRLVEEPAQAEIVRLVFRLYTEEGYRLRPLAAYLNGRGVSPPRAWLPGGKSTRWHVAAVSRMLKNEVYVGRPVWRKTRAGRGPAGELLLSRADPADRVAFGAPPLVSEETFGRAARLLAENFNESARNTRHRDYVLRGLIRCGVCGRAFVGYASNNYTIFYYRCGSSYIKSERCGAPYYVRANVAEAEVWRRVVERVNSPRLVKEEMLRKIRTEAEDLGAHAREAAQVEAALAAKLRGLKEAEERVEGVESVLEELRREAQGADGATMRRVIGKVLRAVIVTPLPGQRPAYRLDLDPLV